MTRKFFPGGLLIAGLMLALTSNASAEMILSQVIIDLFPGKPLRDDIEVWNDGSERMYVAAEPFEILAAGTGNEQRVPAGDPENSGILVSPGRLLLEPGERRAIRIAVVGERPKADRVFRVAIKPVAGQIVAETTALKVFVGYDALLIVRPEHLTSDLVGERAGQRLTLRNTGNTAQELFDGRQCNSSGADCRVLAAKRLYAGGEWEQSLPFDTPVTYKSKIGSTVLNRQF